MKKTLLMLTLTAGFAGGFPGAVMAEAPIHITTDTTYTQDRTIDMDGSGSTNTAGILVDSGAAYTNETGTTVTITYSGNLNAYNNYGVFVAANSQAIFDTLVITSGGAGLYADSGSITTGDNLQITTLKEQAVLARGTDGTVTIGDNAVITTAAGDTTGDHGVQAGVSPTETGSVTIGDNADITTNNDGSYGLYADSDGSTITLGNNSSITTNGASSYGVFAASGGSIVLGDGITVTTNGTGAISVPTDPTDPDGDDTHTKSYGLWSYADANGTSSITAGNDLTVITEGSYSYGLLSSGSELTVQDGLTVTTSGERASGVFAYSSGADIRIGNNATITTTGEYARGLLASAGGSVTVGNGTTIDTSGDSAIGVYATGANTTITLGDNTTITTGGDEAYGITTANGGILTGGTDTTVTTTGDVSAAVFATNDGSAINLGSGTTLNTSGDTSHGVLASVGGTVNLGENTVITTSGDNASGLRTWDLSDAGNGGTITLGDGSSITTSGALSDGVFTYDNGTITLGNGITVTTTGDSSNAVYARGENTSITAGDGLTLNTSGEAGYGLHSLESTLTVGANAGVTTGGDNAHAVYANSGTLTLGDNAALATSGENAHGLYAHNGNASIQSGAGATVTTTGSGAHAVYTDNETGSITLGDNTTLSTQGDNAYALYMENGEITLDGSAALTTSGNDAYGVYMVNGTAALTDNTTISTTGDGAHGIYATGGALELGTALTVTTAGAEAHGIYAEDSAITLEENITVATTGEGSSALYAAGADAVINAGDNGTFSAALAQVPTGATPQAYTEGGTGVVVAEDGGQILFTGNQTVTAGSLDTQFALRAVNDDSPDSVSTISGEGVMKISGGMGTAGNSLIDITMTSGSLFNGFTDNSEGGTINLDIQNSTWNITADSTMNDLTTDGATLYFGGTTAPANRTAYHTLVTDSLSGNADILMAADIARLTGDRLTVMESMDGDYTLSVENNGSQATTGNEVLVMIDADNASTADADVTLANTVEAGAYRYGLRRTGDTWELYATEELSTSGSTAINGFAARYLLNYADTQTLLQRLGNIRASNYTGGLWVRGHGGEFEADAGQSMRDFSMHYYGVQVGGDYKALASPRYGDMYIGAFFGYTQADIDYESGDGDADMKSIGAYATYIMPYGFYADLVAKANFMSNDYLVLDTAGNSIQSKNINSEGVAVTLEIGQRIDVLAERGGIFYMEPQGQLSWYYQDSKEFTASDGMNVNINDFHSLLGRLGLNIGYEYITPESNVFNLYAKGSYVNDFLGDVKVDLNGSQVKEKFGGSWWTYGGGIMFQVYASHNFYVDFEAASGGNFTQPWSVSGGYRFTF